MRELLDNAHLIRPWLLWLIPLTGLVWWWWRRHSDPLGAWRRRIDAELLDALVVNGGDRGGRRGLTLLAVWLLAIVSAAGPAWKPEPNPFAESAPPLMILLKADASMEESVSPPSQLERAQLKIHDLAEAHRGEPIGLIAYAGSAHLVMPATHDSKVIAEMASQISPAVMPEPGDRLDLAIREASRALANSETGGSLLVLADTIGGDKQAIATAHREASSPRVQFLGLSSPGAPVSKSLLEVADALGGTVQPATLDEEDVNKIADRARRQSAGGVGGESGRWQEAGYWLTPVIALIVAFSFRRQTAPAKEAAS